MYLERFQKDILPQKNKMYHFACRLLKNETEAEDAVQDVFIKIWEKRMQWDEIENLNAYIMRMTRNHCFDLLKKKRATIVDIDHHAITNTEAPLERQISSRDTFEQVKKIIHDLPEKQKEAIEMREILGYSYKEIAAILNIAMSDVKVNIFRARKKIQQQILKIEAYEL